MKIYVLLMLIGIIVGFSRLPIRGKASEPAPAQASADPITVTI